MTAFDAIVIGGGHNGLVAATMLGRAGRRVVVLEKQDRCGGAARFAHLLYGPSAVLDACDLGAVEPVPTVALAADGRHVMVTDQAVTHADGGPHPDGPAFLALRRRLLRFAGLLQPVLTAPPPRFTEGGIRQLETLGRLALRLRLLGKAEMREFLRIALSNVYDLIGDELPDGPLAASLAMEAVLGSHVGPRSPGTVLSLLCRLAHGGRHVLPAGGMGTVTARLEEAARAAGVELRTGMDVAGIVVREDRIRGVRLASGQEIEAPRVLSNLDAPATMRLLGVEHLDAEMVHRIRHVRNRGATANLVLNLRVPVRIAGLSEAQQQARLVLAPSMAAMEAAFNPLKYGALAACPMIEAVMPGDGDRLSLHLQYVPDGLEGGWTDAARHGLVASVVAALEPCLPGLGVSVTGHELHTPADIEASTGATGGHWHHGEMALDQLLMLRPVNGMGHYRTGVPGLYLCGAASHPGGDVTGAPGANAARTVLMDGARR